jgi:hypothetical protein
VIFARLGDHVHRTAELKRSCCRRCEPTTGPSQGVLCGHFSIGDHVGEVTVTVTEGLLAGTAAA